MEAEASLVAAALAKVKGPIASLLAGGGEFRANVEAPICLSLGRSTLGGWLSSFLNIASHHEANYGVAKGTFLNFIEVVDPLVATQLPVGQFIGI